ncbi:MAG: Mn2+/Fe2+ NRAMP family transporter [Gammaproteobacteria bacterium]|jgi:Mn2+/Fe2+ NRAMP family transporter
MKIKQLANSLGPGLLFAAVSVGVSHLVQSTRAGAIYGLAMLVFIGFGLITKYPACRFGQQYAVATRTTLLEAFRKQGTWSLVLVGIITFSVMFTGVAAVTLVAAGIAKATFGLNISAVFISACILIAGMTLLTIGKFHWLDISIKVLVIIMAVSTLAATFFAIPNIDWSLSARFLPEHFDMLTIMFIVGLVGWMPVPLDTAILQSIWTVAKSHESPTPLDWRSSSVDFHVGYLGSAFLAVCFLLMGTALIHGSGVKMEGSASGFATQLISLYQQSLGDWSKSIISISALAVMLSTVLTLLDGYPRSIAILYLRFKSAETPNSKDDQMAMQAAYLSSMIILIVGALILQYFFIKSFIALIAFATAISFITAPFLAWLIHRAMTSSQVPAELRPGRFLRAYSLTSVCLLTFFALYYIYLLISTSF